MQEQMRLYKEHGVNPVAGCLPMLVQMPVWLALYGALSHLATDHARFPEFAQPFLWIPNLGQPEFLMENFPYQLPILAILTARHPVDDHAHVDAADPGPSAADDEPDDAVHAASCSSSSR